MYNPIYLKNVVTLELDLDKCIGCGMCTEVCPHEVFAFNSCKAVIIDRDSCMECGACKMNCPAAAISVDVGVGCAAAVINTALGRESGSCCCIIESTDSPTNSQTDCGTTKQKSVCC